MPSWWYKSQVKIIYSIFWSSTWGQACSLPDPLHNCYRLMSAQTVMGECGLVSREGWDEFERWMTHAWESVLDNTAHWKQCHGVRMREETERRKAEPTHSPYTVAGSSRDSTLPVCLFSLSLRGGTADFPKNLSPQGDTHSGCPQPDRD